MSKEKFTPGPWHVAQDERIPYLIYGADHYAVADLKVFHGKHDIEADKRLILNAVSMFSLLRDTEEALQAISEGKRDGATMGRLSIQREKIALCLKDVRGEKISCS
jgi:hypothetical protein